VKELRFYSLELLNTVRYGTLAKLLDLSNGEDAYKKIGQGSKLQNS
jgi:hypothetical protein